ncbi:unnamed protein product [Adineta ricciae]|uniref:Uncharacterized protein n=1 Tax=Adineta ricciae TaxID=249248 RepID=A0A814VI81_ADIRI|nr:unnamed protein product [Adineta ricciae]
MQTDKTLPFHIRNRYQIYDQKECSKTPYAFDSHDESKRHSVNKLTIAIRKLIYVANEDILVLGILYVYFDEYKHENNLL